MRKKSTATARNTAWKQKKSRKRNISTLFLFLFHLLFFCLDLPLVKPNRKPEGMSLSDAVQLRSISGQNRAENELRVWEAASKWLPMIIASWYSFPCVSSPWSEAGKVVYFWWIEYDKSAEKSLPWYDSILASIMGFHIGHHPLLSHFLTLWEVSCLLMSCPIESPTWQKNEKSLQPNKELRPSVQQPWGTESCQ